MKANLEVLDLNRQVTHFRISYPGKIQFGIMNYGCSLTDIIVPDNSGMMENVLLRYDEPEDFFRDEYYMNAIIGRFANRIDEGKFKLDGKTIELSQNEFPHHNHGGKNGFNKRAWKIDDVKNASDETVISFSRLSKDGEEGYPGNVIIQAKFYFREEGFQLKVRAKSDQDTLFNPTYHPYFNLSGGTGEGIENHSLKINADKILEMDHEGIPTGILKDIAGSHFDFRESKLLEDLVFDHGGIDKHYLWDGRAELYHDINGRKLIIESEMPGLQVYSGLFLNDSVLDMFFPNAALCLEPQFYPDNPNHDSFEKSILRKGEEVEYNFHYKFELE